MAKNGGHLVSAAGGVGPSSECAWSAGPGRAEYLRGRLGGRARHRARGFDDDRSNDARAGTVSRPPDDGRAFRGQTVDLIYRWMAPIFVAWSCWIHSFRPSPTPTPISTSTGKGVIGRTVRGPVLAAMSADTRRSRPPATRSLSLDTNRSLLARVPRCCGGRC
jgi:hypothetical protein